MFLRNFIMTLAASGALEVGVKYQYLCTLVCREALRPFDSLSADLEGTQTLNVDYIIKGLAQHSSPVNSVYKKTAMHRGMKTQAL